MTELPTEMVPKFSNEFVSTDVLSSIDQKRRHGFFFGLFLLLVNIYDFEIVATFEKVIVDDKYCQIWDTHCYLINVQ